MYESLAYPVRAKIERQARGLTQQQVAKKRVRWGLLEQVHDAGRDPRTPFRTHREAQSIEKIPDNDVLVQFSALHGLPHPQGMHSTAAAITRAREKSGKSAHPEKRYSSVMD